MARRNPRPEATQEKILTPLKECCEQCGQPLWVANHSHRTVTTLSGLWKLTLVVRQCIEPTCPRFHQRYRPEEEGRCRMANSAVARDCFDRSVALSRTPQCPRNASGASGARHQCCAAQCDLFDAALSANS